MTSEIRANTLKNRVGLGTVSFTNTGPVVSGIVTIANSTAEGVRLEDNAGVGGSLKITTPSGYVSIGAGNATFVHLQTDRGSFYFQKRIIVDEGIIGSYDDNLTLQSPLNNNRVTINKDTGLVSILNDLDVDGHTNLDNVSVAGVSTFSGVLDATNTPASIRVAQDIQHKGDADTKLNFHDADKFRIELGGTIAFSGLKSTSGATHAKWGINVATPQAALHIDEAYNHQGVLRVTNGNQNSGYYHQLEMSGTNNIFTLWRHFDGSNYYNTHLHGSTGHRWYINGSEAVRVHSDGNVGIGVNDPDAKLEVLEDIFVKGSSGDGDTGIQIRSGSSALSNQHQIRTGGGNGNMLFLEAVGNTGIIAMKTAGSERLRIGSVGQIGIAGANYGTSGQVLTSGGASGAVSWTTITGTTINNNANNYIITGSGTANTLEAESTVTFISPQLRVNAGDTSSIQVDGLYSYMQAAGVKLWRGAGNRSHNMGCGANTLANASGGQDCTALGHNALQNSTSGSANTALGSHSMVGTVTGSNNVAVGHGALNKNTSGYNNTVVGRIAGLENLGGHNNTFLGMDAGTNNTSGYANIYAGSGAGKYESTSRDNVAIGWNCFGGERSGGNSNQFNRNTVVGHQALAQQRITNGDGENVCLGYRAMYNTQTAAWRNVVIGFEAGYNNQASKTTFVGTYAGKGYQSGGNTMCLGYNAGTASSPSGNLTNQQDTVVLGDNNISQFYCSDTSISSSDARDKTDITEWTHGLSFINQLKPVTYRWDKRTWYGTDEEPIGTPDGSKKRARLHLGFLAQDALEVEKSFGYASKKDDMLAVNLNEDGSAYGMKYERLVVPLTKAVQELSAEVDALKAKIAALEGS